MRRCFWLTGSFPATRYLRRQTSLRMWTGSWVTWLSRGFSCSRVFT